MEKIAEAQKVLETRPNKALRLLEDAIVLLPSNYQAYIMRAGVYFSKGQYKEAKDDYVKVLRIDPENETANQMIEKIKYKTGESLVEIKDKRLFNHGYEHKLIYSPRRSAN